MRENFAQTLDIEASYEGGYSNHPADKGGPTMWGVTQRVYDAYRKSIGQEPRSVRALTKDEWREIFRRQYWDVINGDELAAGVDLIVMDGAINSGSYQSGLWLQRALGGYYNGKIDGHIGVGTIDAVNAHPDHDALIADMLGRRLGMLQNLSNWGSFGKGWSARVANVKAIGQAWASGSVGPEPVAAHVEGGNEKAYASDVALPPVSEQAGTQTAVGGGTIGTLLETGRQQLEPLVYTSQVIRYVWVGLTVVAIVVAIGGAVYAFWAARKNSKARQAIEGGIVADVPVLEGQPA